MSHKASFTKSFLIAIIALILNTLSLNGISQNVGYDVYSAGYYSFGGENMAAIYKNNEKLYTIENGPNTNAMNLTVSPNGDIYWLMKATDDNSVIGAEWYYEINDNDSFKIYPNPTNGSFILETESNATFKITNIVGQTIISGNLETGTNSIDVNGLNDGIYFITSGNATKKLVIKR